MNTYGRLQELESLIENATDALRQHEEERDGLLAGLGLVREARKLSRREAKGARRANRPSRLGQRKGVLARATGKWVRPAELISEGICSSQYAYVLTRRLYLTGELERRSTATGLEYRAL
jgi:hypothetical protein